MRREDPAVRSPRPKLSSRIGLVGSPARVGVEVVDLPDLEEAVVGYLHQQGIGGASTNIEILAAVFKSLVARLR